MSNTPSEQKVTRADVLQDAQGRSKGCGLVEFKTAAQARAAIQTLNNTDLDGRQIFIREVRLVRLGGRGKKAGEGKGEGKGQGNGEGKRAGKKAFFSRWGGEGRGHHTTTKPDRSTDSPPPHHHPATPPPVATTTGPRGGRRRRRAVGQRREPGGGRGALDPTKQAQRVYVGNLSWNVDREQLRSHMAEVGDQCVACGVNDCVGCGCVFFWGGWGVGGTGAAAVPHGRGACCVWRVCGVNDGVCFVWVVDCCCGR